MSARHHDQSGPIAIRCDRDKQAEKPLGTRIFANWRGLAPQRKSQIHKQRSWQCSLHHQDRATESPVTMSNTNRPHIGRPTVNTARNTQARAVRTREAIVSAAAHHFDADGYGATSMNALLASGTITKGAIYHHFPSKEAVAQQLVADWNHAVNGSISEAIGTGRPAVDQLTAIFTSLGDGIAAGTNLRAGMKLTLEPTIDNGAAFAHWVDTLSDIVDTAIADGELPDTPAAHRLAWNLCAGTVGAAHASVILREDVGLGDRVHDVVSAHLAAFSEGTPSEPRLST